MVPTVFVGIGQRGARIAIAGRKRALLAHPTATEVMVVVAVVPEGQCQIECSEVVALFVTGGGEQPYALPDDHATLIEQVAAQVVNASARREADIPAGAPCEILIVADVVDPCVQALVLSIADAFGRTVSHTIAGMSANVISYLIIPRGRCARGEAVVATLEAIWKAADGDAPPFAQCFVVSGASPSAVYTDEELDSQCATILAMRAAAPVGDAMRQDEGFLSLYGDQRMGCIGLATVELPVRAIAERVGLKGASAIVEKGLNAPCTRPADVEQAVEEALKRLQLHAEGFSAYRERMTHYDTGGVRRSVKDDIRIPHLAFDKVERKRWHVLIANYEIYFRRERLDVAVARVKATACEIRQQTVEAIRGAVDRVIRRGRDPSNGLEVLRQLHAAADGAREELHRDRVKQYQPEVGSEHEFTRLLRELGESAASEPCLSGMLFRGMIASAAIAVTLMGFVKQEWLIRVPCTGAEALGYWIAAFLLPFVISFVLAWRRAQQARARTDDLRTRCQQAMYGKASAKIDATVEHGLDAMTSTAYCLTGNPDELRHVRGADPDITEWRVVEEFSSVLSDALPRSLRQPVEARVEGWRLDLQRYSTRPVVFPYANDESFGAWTDEAETLISNGLFSGWRTATADSLARAIEEYAIARNEYILSQTLETFYQSWIVPQAGGGDPLLRLYNDLCSAAEPTVMTRDLTDDIMRSVYFAGPAAADGPFATALCDKVSGRGAIPHYSSCECVLIRMICGIRPGNLEAWEPWHNGVPESGERGDEAR